MNKRHILAVALGGLVAVTCPACKEQGAQPAAAHQQMAPVKVAVMKMHQQNVDLYSTWFGHLRGVEQADIRPEVSGKLLYRVYKDGSLCQKDDILFEIDPASYKAVLAQAEASVAAAQASVLQAEAAHARAVQDEQRYAALVKNGSVSEKQYTDAQQAARQSQAALAAAQAQVKLAEAACETARINLDRCTIRAPFTGLASRSSASIGDLLSASGAPLTTMSSIDPIRVDFSVPGKQVLSTVMDENFGADNQETPIKEFELLLEDGSVFEKKGEVVAVDSEVSQSTGTVNFIGHVSNPNLKLRSGMAVRVRAKTGTLENALLVPSRAVLSAMNHRYIYVVAPDKTPLGIDVKLGEHVTLPMPNGNGETAEMLMVVVTGTVKPIAETLKENGIENVTDADVIVEGSQMAARYAQVNGLMRSKGAKGGFGTVVPEPFIYTLPTSTMPSVTTKSEN